MLFKTNKQSINFWEKINGLNSISSKTLAFHYYTGFMFKCSTALTCYIVELDAGSCYQYICQLQRRSAPSHQETGIQCCSDNGNSGAFILCEFWVIYLTPVVMSFAPYIESYGIGIIWVFCPFSYFVSFLVFWLLIKFCVIACLSYHVTNFFAPSSRFGTPDDLKSLIDKAHELGLIVLMDIVHRYIISKI